MGAGVVVVTGAGAVAMTGAGVVVMTGAGAGVVTGAVVGAELQDDKPASIINTTAESSFCLLR